MHLTLDYYQNKYHMIVRFTLTIRIILQPNRGRMKELEVLLQSTGISIEAWISLWGMMLAFLVLWYQGKLPTSGALQDLTTILNSRGGNILVLAAAAFYFFYRSEHMYSVVMTL